MTIINILIKIAISELEKEDRRATDSNILMKLREFDDWDVKKILYPNEKPNINHEKQN